MSYSAISVANAFLTLAKRDGKQLTNMKIQKLVYIAQGFSLSMLGAPLFENAVHAFQWGPVMPALYEAIKQYGSEPIPDIISSDEPAIDIDDPTCIEAAIIRGVWEQYGSLTAAQLSAITHQSGTPWNKVWKKVPYGVIPRGLIKNHYDELLTKTPS